MDHETRKLINDMLEQILAQLKAMHADFREDAALAAVDRETALDIARKCQGMANYLRLHGDVGTARSLELRSAWWKAFAEKRKDD